MFDDQKDALSKSKSKKNPEKKQWSDSKVFYQTFPDRVLLVVLIGMVFFIFPISEMVFLSSFLFLFSKIQLNYSENLFEKTIAFLGMVFFAHAGLLPSTLFVLTSYLVISRFSPVFDFSRVDFPEKNFPSVGALKKHQFSLWEFINILAFIGISSFLFFSVCFPLFSLVDF
jgi:hypothetical protein